MNVNGSSGPAATQLPDEIDASAAKPQRAAQNQTSQYQGTQEAVHAAHEVFDLFKALGELFDGKAPQGNSAEAANKFDLGAILSSIFDFAEKKAGEAPKEKTETPTTIEHDEKKLTPEQAGAVAQGAMHSALKNDGPYSRGGTVTNRQEVKAGEKVQVSVSGETGDEHFKAKGRASAEAHAQANAYSESFSDGQTVGVRAGAEASLGVSAEAEGSIKTDIGEMSGRVKASAEIYARAQAEAIAGPKGANASVKAEAGAMARGEAETDLNIGGGWVKGHADALAETGAGGKAKARVGVSFDPPEAALNAKAEAFAGARAGYSAKGGVAGIGYGVACEVWAGAGAKAEINGGLDKDGKFKIEFSIGIAAGVGAMFKINFEFDTKAFGKAASDVVAAAGDIIGGIFGAVAGLFDGCSGKGKHAGEAIANAIKQIAPAIGQAAADAAGKEFENQKASGNPDFGERVKSSSSGSGSTSTTTLTGALA